MYINKYHIKSTSLPMAPPTTSIRYITTRHFYDTATTIGMSLPFRQPVPDLKHAGTVCREHAVLHTVEVSTVYGRHELAGDEAQNYAQGEVVFAQPVAELEVLVEHGAEREGNGLFNVSMIALLLLGKDGHTSRWM
jgi:hypothetical protein